MDASNTPSTKTRYSVTAVSSVAASQFALNAVPEIFVAVMLVGTEGAVVSEVVVAFKTVLLSDLLLIKSLASTCIA